MEPLGRALAASAGVAPATRAKIITTAAMRAIVERETSFIGAPRGLDGIIFISGIGTFTATVYTIVCGSLAKVRGDNAVRRAR